MPTKRSITCPECKRVIKLETFIGLAECPKCEHPINEQNPLCPDNNVVCQGAEFHNKPICDACYATHLANKPTPLYIHFYEIEPNKAYGPFETAADVDLFLATAKLDTSDVIILKASEPDSFLTDHMDTISLSTGWYAVPDANESE